MLVDQDDLTAIQKIDIGVHKFMALEEEVNSMEYDELEAQI